MLASELKTRLQDTVESLSGRIHEAADLAELVRQGALPQATPAAYVLPLGLSARGEGSAVAGAFTQPLDETFAIVLVVRASGDVTGGKALPAIDQLVNDILGAVAGWAPDGAIGVFRLVRGNLVSLNAGAVIYQLDFSLQQQLRVIS